MPSFILRNLDPEFWRRVEAKAAAEGVTVKTVILRLLASWIAIPVALLLLMPALMAAQGPSLSDADIDTAIKAGQAKKFAHLVSDCLATVGMGESISASIAGGTQYNAGFDITVSANQGRIASLAAEAKRLYKSFALADVPETLRTPSIFVFADPHKPSRNGSTVVVASPIDQIVLKSKTKPDVVLQPETFDTEPVEWSNLMGGKVEANRGLALFSYAAVKDLPAGDLDVVVVTQAGERKCKIGTKDRAKLFPAK